ncbi:MAG: glycogen debranching enzyme GlgX [Curvibacter sp. RIFCSPHIGHO2_12_FULL_63_18]|uniref:glycogen debranching protein GlgX n=1 Tax=Rhodoferax sp. TaxID=50421 RepID=UPI0008C439D3|nr:glycogen debranching protein GlgX [Rhodoferax sp.]OGO96738.1 MAG: glycogen debranching enzyme GlgX [Curvibacter sp. GWA2_63_95]OGO98620.1 MAG: glycogen debranching enzyme GlgX [Curvibacter sp. RIFCSPHIGHO2_12_FULL_63_18]HCX80481.1 glycogen debranching enzyme GlgX [Rhodoferax sp.]
MTLQPGQTHTLGAQLCDQGVNFCLAAPNAQAVELCLFDASATQEVQRLAMQGPVDGLWHGFLPGAQVGLVYGWRVHGPWDPAQGHRFNPAKLLLDPAAREVVGCYDGDDIHNGHEPGNPGQRDTRDNLATALKARVVQDLLPPMARVRVDPAQRVLYELHLKGFTALHPEVPETLRGTYAGLAHPAAIAHLRKLGITTVSLMPVAHRADEVRLLRMGLSNYWGYSPIAWNAPEHRYWSGTPATSPRSELRALVDALHAAGLEVILDVVYNHTGETDELGPTLSLRGIDNAMYYHLDAANPALYANWTGCGNCVNLTHPLVLRTVMDSLRGWMREFGVDGFRFDLAPVLARAGAEQHNRFEIQAPFLLAVAQDPVLRDCTMVAEPWDIGPGGYQLGSFPPGWLEWNDRFRDTQRSAWLQHHATRADLAQRLAGSAESFAPARRAPHSSVNLITAHDGFTLTDLVSYAQRHNEANGENNRDGHGHNLSVNNGVEGASGDPDVLARRLRQKRVLLASLLWSLGTPMLLAGDEFGQSQGGNNNAYCQDNATTWLHWEQADTTLTAFVAHAIALRAELPLLQSGAWWRGMDAMGSARGPISQWWGPQGQTLAHTDWHHPQDNALMLQLSSGAQAAQPAPGCLLLLNPRPHTLEFVLPAPPPGTQWLQRLETDGGNIHPQTLTMRLWMPGQSLLLASIAPL